MAALTRAEHCFEHPADLAGRHAAQEDVADQLIHLGLGALVAREDRAVVPHAAGAWHAHTLDDADLGADIALVKPLR